jgi:hypothetical protein
MIVGFDPGLSGGIAFVSNDGALIDCQDLPVIGEGTQRRIDAANLAAIIRSHNPTRAVIEAVGARPGQGVSSMFRFGQSVGILASRTDWQSSSTGTEAGDAEAEQTGIDLCHGIGNPFGRNS